MLAVDLGTGGPKVGLVDVDGDILWRGQRAVETRHLRGGGAVQDADEWWRAVLELARDGLRSGIVDPAAVIAIAVTGQYASTVPVDDDGEPTGDCLLWMDTRAAPLAAARFGGSVAGRSARMLTSFLRTSGGVPSLDGDDPVGHRLLLSERHPDVVAASRWLMEPIDQLVLRLSGRAAATPATMAVSWLVDTHRDGHDPSYDRDLLRIAGVDADRLPPLVPIGSIAGPVLPDIADRLGLRGDVVVVTGAPDLHTAALGSGAVHRHRAHLALSTSSWISCPVERHRVDVRRQVSTVPGLRPDGRLIIDNHEVGASALAWWRDRVTEISGPTTFEDLTADAAMVPAGAGGVIFTPWLAGERSPVDDRLARGGFTNLSLGTNRAHLARAVLEGVAHNSRWLLDAVEHVVGRHLEPIRIMGGGAVSDLWCQIHADVLDRVVERPAQPMWTNLRGAAFHAALALGLRDLDDVAAAVPVTSVFRPDPSTRVVHDEHHAVFPDLHRRQRRIFRALNSADRRSDRSD